MEKGNSLFVLPTPKQSYKLMYPSKWWAITAWFQLHRTHAQALPSASLVSSSPSQFSLPFYPSLPPSSTSMQNPTSFNPVSPALTEIPFQLTPPHNSQPHPSKLRLTIPATPLLLLQLSRQLLLFFLIPTSWSDPQHPLPTFSTQALCGFICSSSI